MQRRSNLMRKGHGVHALNPKRLLRFARNDAFDTADLLKEFIGENIRNTDPNTVWLRLKICDETG